MTRRFSPRNGVRLVMGIDKKPSDYCDHCRQHRVDHRSRHNRDPYRRTVCP